MQSLAWGPSNQARSWSIYLVNGFKFHTKEWATNQLTYNCGLCVRGDAGSGETDWYGIIKEILEIEYSGAGDRTIVLFYCDWFDPRRPQGTRTYRGYKITEVKHTKRYSRYDPFILAQNAVQVYYLPYPARIKPHWWVVRKTKPRGFVEVKDLQGRHEEIDEAFQADGPMQVTIVEDTDVPHSLRALDEPMDEVDHQTHAEVHTHGPTDEDEDEDEDEIREDEEYTEEEEDDIGEDDEDNEEDEQVEEDTDENDD